MAARPDRCNHLGVLKICPEESRPLAIENLPAADGMSAVEDFFGGQILDYNDRILYTSYLSGQLTGAHSRHPSLQGDPDG
jgi:hypothetical protein